MARYITKRLLWMIPVIVGVILIVFFLRAITPGDPVDNLVSEDASEEVKEALREELGLNDPLAIQFVKYVGDVFTFDLGTSYITKQPVLQEILNRLPTTAIICFGAVILGFIFGVPMGVYSAYRQYSMFDSAMLVISMLAQSIPGFCLALLMISLFSVELGWFPAYGISDWKSYILPMFVVGISSMSMYCRTTRSSMLEVIRSDYIRTARAKGQTENVILWGHGFQNASIPVVAAVGNQVARQLGGALVIENVFGIPGIGKYLGDAVAARNYPAVQGGVIFLAVVFCVINLLVDIAFTYINPKLKTVFFNSPPSKFERWLTGLFAKKEVTNG